MFGIGAEGVYLMAHLVVTLGILGAYIYSLVTGHEDASLRDLLFIAGGYWFGTVGLGTVKAALTGAVQQAPAPQQPVEPASPVQQPQQQPQNNNGRSGI